LCVWSTDEMFCGSGACLVGDCNFWALVVRLVLHSRVQSLGRRAEESFIGCLDRYEIGIVRWWLLVVCGLWVSSTCSSVGG